MAKLLVVPTPIGNLKDITLRSLEALNNSDLVIAEDTRTTGNLLRMLKITGKRLVSFHLHNEHKVLDDLISCIQNAANPVLVSDAGTPCISDPGFLLVRECVSRGIEVECLPGPTALIPALVVSGFPTDRFIFEGFLPPKKGRLKKIQAWLNEERTVVFFESPHKLVKCLNQLLEVLGSERKVCVVRELSKKFEQIIRGSVKEVVDFFVENKPRGEFVVVLKGVEKASEEREKEEL